jgi:hypothetical protein
MTGVTIGLAAVAWALGLHAVVNAALLRRPTAAAEPHERVSVLMPMRNEAHRLQPMLQSVLDQRLLGDVEVIVLDDESTDGTPDLVRSLGVDVKVIAGTAPPAGWLGKNWACEQLADSAGGSVLVFLDADVVLEPEAVAAAVGLMRSRGLAFVSPYPRQLAGPWLGLLVQPLLHWSWLTFLPLRLAESSGRGALSAANGQLLVVDASAYRAAGGHAAVAGSVIEDVALARALKAAGFRGGMADGSRLATCRMYDAAGDLVDGYAKSLWAAFGSTAGAAAVSTMLLVLYVVPWMLVAVTPWAWVPAAAGPAGRVVTAARMRSRPLPDALLHPLSILVFVVLLAMSVHRHRSRKTLWKGRLVP